MIADLFLYVGAGSLSLAASAFAYGVLQNQGLQQNTSTAGLWSVVVYDNR